MHYPLSLLIGLGMLAGSGCTQAPVTPVPSPNRPVAATGDRSAPQIDDPVSISADEKPPEAIKWQVLFDGTSLAEWEATSFGGEGECTIVDKTMWVEMGGPMSGMTYLGDDLPLVNYEISLEAKRVEGVDFFCGLTFPVDDSHCSLIVGGWAGSLVGLSCIDDKDASDNETKKILKFDDDRWYEIRVRVEADRIRSWIDDELVVDLKTTGRKISLRNETLPSRPLGVSSFQTTAAYRNIKIRRLK